MLTAVTVVTARDRLRCDESEGCMTDAATGVVTKSKGKLSLQKYRQRSRILTNVLSMHTNTACPQKAVVEVAMFLADPRGSYLPSCLRLLLL